MKKLTKVFNIVISLVIIFLSVVPGQVKAAPSIHTHNYEAALLMLASHRLLEGDGSLAAGPVRMASPAEQTSVNEIEIMIDLLEKQVAAVKASGYDETTKARVIDQLEAQIRTLKARAQQLNARRRRKRGFFRRIARALGRGAGWVMGEAMEGAGKVVEYGVEQVAPQVIKDAVFTGSPLTGTAFRSKFVQMLRKRVENVLVHGVENKAAVVAAEPADEEYDPDFDLDAGDDDTVFVPDGGEVDSEQNAGVEVYDFGPDDGISLSGNLAWYGFSKGPVQDVFIEYLTVELLHLEVDKAQQLVSGSIKFSGTQNSTPLENGDYVNRNGEAIIKFENIRMTELSSGQWRLEGGSGTANIAMGAEYQITGMVEPDRASIGSSYNNDPNVPVQYVFGEFSNRLILELDAYQDDVQMGAYIEISVPNLAAP